MKLSSLFTSFTFLAQGFLTLALNSGQLYCGSYLNTVEHLGKLYISEMTEKCSARVVAEFMGKTIKTPLQQKRGELRLAQGLTHCLFSSSGPNQDDEGRRTEFNNRLVELSRIQKTLAAEIKEVENGGAVLGYDTKNNEAAT
ncbi:hypothetical protein N7497_007983 [Penicillium chrysogenum]|uniref:Uncharacterized protein n=1 Tax=Penicillium chrysogenum TaxID=5076 RepID=A0ABQ8WQB7_PENCH|nr:hypothetical protein N7505_006999 [Penicillium chrysogenum]KAJ6146001.1 hypothetical protein N7497_007983 [Penicillium chrysogenum]